MADKKHKYYELLNLTGYGLAKFNMDFVKEFGFPTKSALYEHFVKMGIAETVGVVKNRQDLFDPFFDSGRKGWWQRGNDYIHRKIHIDTLFGDLGVKEFATVVKVYIENKFGSKDTSTTISPLMRSRFKQLQMTGREAELYFMNNFRNIEPFASGDIDDARTLGDGYDFQIQTFNQYFLAEIKGIRAESGNIRITEKEYSKAKEYKADYSLVVVSNLAGLPKMTAVFDPIANLTLTKRVATQSQITYHSEFVTW